MSRCFACAHESITSLPEYLKANLDEYFAEIDDCTEVVIPMGFEAETVAKHASKQKETGNLDHHCKTSKISHLNKMLDSIKARVEAWATYVKEDHGLKGLQALFTKEEIHASSHYVPRCKYIHNLFGSVVTLGVAKMFWCF